MGFEQLTSHSFVTLAFKHGIDVSEPLRASRIYEVEAKYLRALDEYEWYIIEVSRTLAQALNIFQQMTYAVSFLATSALTRKMREHGINRADYIRYNIENYLIRTQSLNDRALKLTNAVFHLGLDLRHCTFDIISKNLHVQATKVPARLQRLWNISNKYHQDRNMVIHSNSYDEDELRELEMFYLVASKGGSHDTHDAQVFTYHAKHLAQNYVKQKTTEFDTFNQTVLEELTKLFDTLEPKYIYFEKALSIKCGHQI